MAAKHLEDDDLENRLVFNTAEAMRYIGYGRTKFYQLLRTGQIKGRWDGRWRFDRVELEKYKKRSLR